ncbi:DUF6048 family protein [Elizabethkingia miricola]|uniref:DUF6048 family protein n=1 Tax=Elizabethkingia miricola TaxID=172045 RepID=UPI0009998875|nr:DUF6048 family protein [Elizabethkingia miricola]OPC14550.1 hypothetical protein BAY01_09240 [Elizabethkingia miricola]
MKLRLFYTLIFSLFISLSFAQEKKKISSDTLAAKKWKYKPNVMIGVDVLHLGLMAFTDQKLFQAFATSRIQPRLHLVADVGYEKNKYDKNGYDVSAKGLFVKAGTLYMLSPDPENKQNGFYAGGKVAASFYQQEMRSIPTRGYQGHDFYASFPTSSQSAYWLEGAIGGRVELFHSNFYIDAQVQPKYMIYTTKQENITPMVIPGFGTDANKFKLGFMWSIAYLF